MADRYADQITLASRHRVSIPTRCYKPILAARIRSALRLRLIASLACRAFLLMASRKILLCASIVEALSRCIFFSTHAKPDRHYCLLHQREALITSLLCLNIGRGEPTIEASSDSQNKWDVKAHLVSHSDTVIIHFWHKIDNSAQNRHNVM